MSRITRKSMILTNYDATACYDRIVPNLAMLASRRFGVSERVTLSNARTLEKADYGICTEVATEGYRHSPEFPIYEQDKGVETPQQFGVSLLVCYTIVTMKWLIQHNI